MTSVRSLVQREPPKDYHYSEGTNGRCEDRQCRNCGVLKFYRNELVHSISGQKGKRLIVDCENSTLVTRATAELIQHLFKSEVKSISKFRPSSFSEGCPTYASVVRNGQSSPQTGNAAVKTRLDSPKSAPDSSYFIDYWQRVLHGAAGAGNLKLVNLAIANGANVNGCDFDGTTALHLAIVAGALDVANFLVQSGAHVGQCDHAGSPPLLVAVWQRNIVAARLLLRHGAMAKSNNSRNKVMLALFHTDMDAFKDEKEAAAYHEDILIMLGLLLEYGAPVHVVDGQRNTLLHLASRVVNIEVIRMLLEHGVPVKKVNRTGNTALHLVAGTDLVEAVRLLLDHGAYLDIQNEDSDVPLAISIKHHQSTVAKVLLERGAAAETVDLALAIEDSPDFEFVNKLLDRGANVKGCSRHEKSALIVACEAASMDITRLLVERGADLNDSTSFGVCPLSAAAALGRIDVVNLLLAQGARTDVEVHSVSVNPFVTGDTQIHLGSLGCLAMFEAAAKGHTAIVELLLANGVKPNDLEYRHSMLCAAASAGRLESVRTLVENEADVNGECRYCKSVLVSAAKRHQYNVVNYLVLQGADARAKDYRDCTALFDAIPVRKGRRDRATAA